MIVFKAQNQYDVNFNDQIIIESYPISELNSNITINLEYIYASEAGVLKLENRVVEVFDEFVEHADVDFIDKDYVMIDPEWTECPEGLDLLDMNTWPEGMVYADIPKVVTPDYVEKTKYFSRLYKIIIGCVSEEEIVQKIFKFICLDEPHFFEQVVGHDSVVEWQPLEIDTAGFNKDLNSLKSHKIQILKSMVSARLLHKYDLIKQLNFMSDSLYSRKSLCVYLGKTEEELITTINDKIGTSDNVSDLKLIKVSDLDFTDVMSNLLPEYSDYTELAQNSLIELAQSILGHRKIRAMRNWCTTIENQITGALTVEEVVSVMNNLIVPEV